ncbi:ABC transporter permease subunit [Butyrivibrio sp. JL13D10]|uniref:ABC transporter permease subunit n=1 Tax=Butyrivibrio sp. JL13D10 TaxID=3236815 RepID=UPI0038B482E3
MNLKQFLKRNYLFIALLLAIVIFGFSTEGKLFYETNIKNLFLQNIYVFVLSSGMFLCILAGGNTDLSCGSGLYFIAAVGAYLMQRGIEGIPAFIAMLITGCLIGIWHGILIGKLELPSMIVTLAGMSIFQGFGDYIIGGFTLSVTNEQFLSIFGLHGLFSFPLLIVLLCILATIYTSELSPFGRHIYALGGNVKAARSSGISPFRVVFFTYVYMGIMTAISAALVAGRMGIVPPGLGKSYEMDAIAACFIGGTAVTGGKGRMLGVILGALLMGIINQGMSIIGISANWQAAVKGVLLVCAVLLGNVSIEGGRVQL